MKHRPAERMRVSASCGPLAEGSVDVDQVLCDLVVEGARDRMCPETTPVNEAVAEGRREPTPHDAHALDLRQRTIRIGFAQMPFYSSANEGEAAVEHCSRRLDRCNDT